MVPEGRLSNVLHAPLSVAILAVAACASNSAPPLTSHSAHAPRVHPAEPAEPRERAAADAHGSNAASPPGPAGGSLAVEEAPPAIPGLRDAAAAQLDYGRFLARAGLAGQLTVSGTTDAALDVQLRGKYVVNLAFKPKAYAKDKLAAFDALVAKLDASSQKLEPLLLMAWATARGAPEARAAVVVMAEGADRLIFRSASGDVVHQDVGDKSSLEEIHVAPAVDLSGITLPPSAEAFFELQNELLGASLSRLKAAMEKLVADRKYPPGSYELTSDGERIHFSHYSRGEIIRGHRYWEHLQVWISVKILGVHSASLSSYADGAYTASAAATPPANELFSSRPGTPKQGKTNDLRRVSRMEIRPGSRPFLGEIAKRP